MIIRVPKRFTPDWWLWMSTGVFLFGGAAAGALYWLDIFSDLRILLVVFIAGSVAGDVILALAFEAVAPSAVTLGPGERATSSDELTELGTVVSGFDASPVGKIRIRGEIWRARCGQNSSLTLERGVRVRVLEREGLTLLIAPH